MEISAELITVTVSIIGLVILIGGLAWGVLYRDIQRLERQAERNQEKLHAAELQLVMLKPLAELAEQQGKETVSRTPKEGNPDAAE